MSGLTDEQKKRIEENKRKALEKLKNSSKSSTISSPIKNQTPCPMRVSSSPSTASGTSPPSFYSKELYTKKQKEKAYTNKCKALEKLKQKTGSVTSTVNKNSNVSANLTGYCSPLKGNATESSYPKGYFSPPKQNTKDTERIHLILSMKNSIWFKVDHNSRHQEAVKSIAQTITTRQYDGSFGMWCFHIKDYRSVVQAFENGLNISIDPIPENVVRILQKAHQEHEKTNDTDLTNIGSVILDKLMTFQREGIMFGVQKKGRVLIADDMGLGKTVQAISLCAYYKDEWPVLVICPSSVRMSWQQHFISWIEDIDKDDVNIVSCGKDDPTSGQINIISYDLASKLVGKIYRKRFKIIVADECHFLKNHSAARTKNIVPLLQITKRAVLLSGTPALSRPRELFTQIKALDKTLFPDYHKFSVRYCEGRQTPYGWDDTGSSNDTELQAVLSSSLMIRRMKHEVLHQLPEKQRQIVVLDPSMIKNARALVSEERLFLDAKQDKRSALLNYFKKTCEAKIKGVREYVSEKVECGSKIIVFAHHIQMLDAIEETAILKKVEYIRIDGRTNQKLRQTMIDYFNSKCECLMAILSLTACGTGLNITGSSNVIFAELYWNPGHLRQAEDRAYRIGQKNCVLVTYLVAKKTADDYIWPMVQSKLKVLTNLGVGMEKGFEGKTTNQDSNRQKSMLDFFEMLVEEDDKDFVDQIDKMQEESNKDKEKEMKLESASVSTSTSDNKESVCAITSDDLILDDFTSNDLILDDFTSDDLILDDLTSDDFTPDDLGEPVTKRTKIS